MHMFEVLRDVEGCPVSCGTQQLHTQGTVLEPIICCTCVLSQLGRLRGWDVHMIRGPQALCGALLLIIAVT